MFYEIFNKTDILKLPVEYFVIFYKIIHTLVENWIYVADDLGIF